MATDVRVGRATLCLLVLTCICLGACRRVVTNRPSVEFASVPLAEPGNPNRVSAIRGRAVHAAPNQRIVLYARTDGTWWVQPFADKPFTSIRPDSTWSNSTHPGMEYAALLVGPEFQPPAQTDALPMQAVIAAAVTKGEPPVWKSWWFSTLCGIVGVLCVFGIYRYHLNQLTARLKARFEERLAERTRVAQILHDTLLQDVISAKMQLHVAADRLLPDSPAMEPLNHVLHSLGQVVDEGRNTLRGMRSPLERNYDLEKSLAQLPEELKISADIPFQVTMKCTALPLQPSAAAELYSIAKDTLIYAIQKATTERVEIELRGTMKELRLLMRVTSLGADSEVLSIVRDRAERLGSRFSIRHRLGGKREIEVRVPGHIAFETHPPIPLAR